MTILEHISAKIIDYCAIASLREQWRNNGTKAVFTNGCFDILHRGHVEYLSQAADLGDILVVGLNSDESVRRLKGSERPLQDQISRALVLAALEFVGYVVIFDSDTPYELIKHLCPDVLVKGADYLPEQIAGSDIVYEYGGSVVTVPLTSGYSTSKIAAKFK